MDAMNDKSLKIQRSNVNNSQAKNQSKDIDKHRND